MKHFCCRVAHSLYWLLVQSLPGQSPQNTEGSSLQTGTDDGSNNEELRLRAVARVKVARYRRRLQMLLRALYTVGGQAMRNSFARQQELLKVAPHALCLVLYFHSLDCCLCAPVSE